jgi:cell division protein FtsI (penicillin-binding protein 3)
MTRRPEQSSLNLRLPETDSGPDREARFFLEGCSAQTLETGRTRLLAAGVVFAMAFLLVGWRLVDIATFSTGGEPKIAMSKIGRAHV